MIPSNRNRSKYSSLLVLLSLIASVAMPNQQVSAKTHKSQIPNSSQVSMCIYPVVKGADGKQYIVTKSGVQVHVPGLGIAADAKQIELYSDAHKNFWYVDKKGHTIKMTDEQVEWGLAQAHQQVATSQNPMMQGQVTQAQAPAVVGQQIMVPQTQAPAVVGQQIMVPQTQANIVVPNTKPAKRGLGSTIATGLAAAGGAIAGAALTSSAYDNNYYGAPYGVPMYHNGGRYYYDGGRGRVYVPPNFHYTNQWNQQHQWNQPSISQQRTWAHHQAHLNQHNINRNARNYTSGRGRRR